MRLSFAITLLIISLVLASAAQLLFRFVMQQFDSSGHELASLITAVSTRLNMADGILLSGGIGLYALSMVSWVLALARFEVSQAYPATSITYVVVYFGAVLIPGLDESISLPSLLGVGLIVAGVIFIAQENNVANKNGKVIPEASAPRS